MATAPSIPVVDFSAFSHTGEEHTDKAKQLATAQQLDDALQNIGFVTLRNFGITDSFIEEALDWSRKFFALSPQVKGLAPHPPGYSHHRGWSGPGQEKLSQHVYNEDTLQQLKEVQEMKETFDIGNMSDKLQPNIWLPEEQIPGFRAFMEKFFDLCARLISQLLQALAVALNLDDIDALSKTHERQLFQTRLVHYPSIETSLLATKGKDRCAAHSDFGTLTLLFQDTMGGLEIQDPNAPNTFIPITLLPGTVVVNCGDLLERWSNGRWRSTVHRVTVPRHISAHEVLPSRYSIPFFAVADPETWIEPLPGCWDEEARPKRYEPITAWGYVQMRMAAIR